MDIRNFFGPKKSKGKGGTKSSASSSASNNDNDSKPATKKAAAPSSTKKLPPKRKKTTSGTPTPKSEPKAQKSSFKASSSKKRSRIAIESDSDTTASNHDDEHEKAMEIAKPQAKSNIAPNKNDKRKPNAERREVAVEDFFSEPTPKKKKSDSSHTVAPTKPTHDDKKDSDSEGPDSEDEFVPNKDMDNSDDDNLLEMEKTKKNESKPTTPKKKTKSSPKKSPPKRSSTIKSKSAPKSKKTKILIAPETPYPKPFDTEDAPSGCLEDVTFVITGMFANLSREDIEDFVKILGGRVTKAVSGKTNYLLCGSELEDGRDVTDGSKYKKAKELGENAIRILHGEEQFYGIVKTICEMKGGKIGSAPTTADIVEDSKQENTENGQNDTKAVEKPNIVNPYAKRPIANPYAKKAIANPYAKKPVVNPYAKSKQSSSASSATTAKAQNTKMGGRADVDDKYALWADKYAPSSTADILGNKESVRKLTIWLSRWESTNNTAKKGKGRGYNGPPQKAALLSGPPGIGKTTTAVLVAKASGREVLEWNASDVRSRKGIEAGLGDVMGSQVLSFGGGGRSNNSRDQNKNKRCIIMDEVDGMGAGDRSGMAELIKVIKNTKVPIICICNDRQSQKVRSLVHYCLDLRFRRPVKSVIARRATEIGRMENMNIETNAAEAIAESCGNDIRQVLNCIQMWSKNREKGQTSNMTYKDLKDRQNDINKDEMLRVNIFDSTRMIVEGQRGLGQDDVPQKVANKSLYERCDAYFTDYNLMGLNVHQNYLKVMISQFQETKRADDLDAEAAVLERMQEATETMSDYAVSEHRVMSGDQLWQLLPLCSVLTVKAGSHASGKNGAFLPGYPEFAGWLGKNSSRGKKQRILQELNHHMNYNISADKTALRLYYLPIIREHFLTLMKNKEGSKVNETINLMDEYGLDRDDLFENIDEFTLDSKAFKFASLDSKAKAAFTREYNKRVHKSQALVEEQIASKSGKKKKKSDDNESDASSEDEEDDPEEIKKLFKKKGRAKTTKSKAKAGTKRKKKS